MSTAEERLAAIVEWAKRTRDILPDPVPEWADPFDGGMQCAAIEVLEIATRDD